MSSPAPGVPAGAADGQQLAPQAARRAFIYQLCALTCTKLGDALVSSRLVLAWTLSAIGAPGLLLAMLVPLRESLSLLPQLFIAAYLQQAPLRKWYWVAGSVLQACALVGMALALLVLPGNVAAVAIVVLLALFSLARGVCSVVVKDVMGKTVPRSRRGRLTGLSASAAGLAVLLLAALLGGFAPAAQGGGIGMYALLLLIGAGLWLLASALYAGVPETPGPTRSVAAPIADGLRSLSLVYRDRRFRHFLCARMLLVAVAFAIPYIVVLLQRAGDSGIGGLLPLMVAEGAAGLLSGAFWGHWSDRAAHRVMAASALLGAVVIGACLWLNSGHQAWLGNYLAAAPLLFLAAVAHHGARIGRTTYLVDMADGSSRLQYTAVSNMVMGLFLLSGMGLGALDAVYGTASVLWLLLAVALLAALYSGRLPPVE